MDLFDHYFKRLFFWLSLYFLVVGQLVGLSLDHHVVRHLVQLHVLVCSALPEWSTLVPLLVLLMKNAVELWETVMVVVCSYVCVCVCVCMAPVHLLIKSNSINIFEFVLWGENKPMEVVLWNRSWSADSVSSLTQWVWAPLVPACLHYFIQQVNLL